MLSLLAYPVTNVHAAAFSAFGADKLALVRQTTS
jgi:hypothetical protein